MVEEGVDRQARQEDPSAVVGREVAGNSRPEEVGWHCSVLKCERTGTALRPPTCPDHKREMKKD